jgi:hypothetical protein
MVEPRLVMVKNEELRVTGAKILPKKWHKKGRVRSVP